MKVLPGKSPANFNMWSRGCKAMYCPRCDRSLKKDNLERLNEELKKKFNKDALEHGNCPVCGTPLIDVEGGAGQ